MSPKLISQKENRAKDRPNDHLPPSKNGHPMPPKREKGTIALDPGLREKGARREEKTHLLSLTERRKGP